MSYDSTFSFGPATPPDYSYDGALNEPFFYVAHSRASSLCSTYSQDDSVCESFNPQLLTPIKSPIRQHGPLLLPKIRPQDQAIESEPKRMKMTPMPKKNKNFRPSHTRSYTNPEFVTQFSPISTTQNITRSSSVMSPVSMNNLPFSQQRRSSSASLDGHTLGKYGFPYRQMPSYISSVTNNHNQGFLAQPNYAVTAPREPSPMRNSLSYDDLSSIDGSIIDEGPTTTLMTYLTSPNPSPALVRQVNIHTRDPNTKHFWWDIRQLRPWTSFNMATITAVPGLLPLLNIPLPCNSLPIPARTPSNPETEASLINIYTTFYTQKLNSALLLSQGPRHLLMRTSPNTAASTEPTFTSAYTDDNSALIYGRGLGRVVGLVKSFDRWNTGMRVEGNHKKVEYLRGLAHLHRCMREHGCRYGFILTEIELVVVRNGTELTPVFGHIEVSTIQLCEHAPTPSPQTSYASSTSSYASSSCEGDNTTTAPDFSFPIDIEAEAEMAAPQPKMTALMALWYLHMLARDDPLPGEVTWRSEIGAPAEGTRRKCAPKDEWIPEPQLAEKREAKRVRGWVWPEESVNRKELGKRKVAYK